MTVWPGNGNPGATYVLAKPGYLLDLSDQPWAPSYPDAVKSVAQYEGKTYNAVFGLNGIGAVYNEQAMDEGRPDRRRAPGPSCSPSAGPPRPRAPRPSRSASRTTG